MGLPKNRTIHTAVGLAILLLVVSTILILRKNRPAAAPLEIEPAKIKGTQNAKVTLFVYSDFLCPYCKELDTRLSVLLKQYPNDLRIAYKQNPLKMHRLAMSAAIASECAADQEKFWPYHDILFRDEHWAEVVDPKESYLKFAKDLNLEEKKFEACLDSGKKEAVIDKNLAEAKNLLVNGVPTMILNGTKILTSRKLEYLKEVIEKELQRNAS